jgi:RNA polymerase sigma factor (sigma-70 family)
MSSPKHERFDRIYAANLPSILGFAARRCAEQSEAADVAAEVFLVAWRRLDEIADGEERMWLFGVARRVVANHLRGRARRNRLADRLRQEIGATVQSTGQPDPPDGVLDALRQLPDRDRELLQLAVWDGLTPTEIATLECVPAATVRSRLLRARARFREALDDPATQRMSRAGHVSGTTVPADENTWS